MSKKIIENKIKVVLKTLKKRKWTIGVMESCSGGAIMNLITNIPGCSDVFKEGLVTYSDEAKIKAGVNKEVIKKYGVYSKNVAEEMARKIKGEVGIGITGNLPGKVYVAVRVEEKMVSKKMNLKNELIDKIKARIKMKEEIGEMVMKLVLREIMNL